MTAGFTAKPSTEGDETPLTPVLNYPRQSYQLTHVEWFVAKRAMGDLRGYAIVGAAQRLSDISQEAANILRVFPELRGRAGAAGARAAQTESAGSAAPSRKGRRRRPKISAAGRKRISDAQKARWAKLRASKK